jgi:hypothetical protein
MVSLLQYQKNKILKNTVLDDSEIELKLKPCSQEVKLMLKVKSKNNVNPYIKMKVRAMSKSLADVF